MRDRACRHLLAVVYILAIRPVGHQDWVWSARILWPIYIAPDEALAALESHGHIFLVDVVKRGLINLVEIFDLIRHG